MNCGLILVIKQLNGGFKMSMLSSAWNDLMSGLSGENTRAGIEEAARLQLQGTRESLALQQAQFGEARRWMEPYMMAGRRALGPLQVLAGGGTPEQEQAMIAQIQESPTMQAMMEQGENAILQSASATGGLRGGNTMSALAQFRPSMLRSEIQDRYSRLAGLAGMGQATTVGGVAAGQQSASQQAQTMQAGTEAQASATMAAAQARNTLMNNMMQLGMMYAFS